MLLLPLLSLAHAAPLATCARTFQTPDLTDALESAEYQFGKQDADGFRGSAQVVAARVDCFSEPLAPDVLARVYLVNALSAFLDGNSEREAAALAGMAAASPGFQIPSKLVPDGHPVRKALTPASLLLREPVTVNLGKSDAGWIEVDGAHRSEAPTNRDVVLQRFGADGQVAETQYLHAGDSLTAWMAPAEPSPTTPAKPTSPEPKVPAAPLPLVAHRPFAVRASVDIVGSGLGAPTTEAVPGFAGPGGRVAVGAELGAGRVGGFAEAGWLGTFGVAEPAASAQSVTVSGGAQLRIGAATLEAGPLWLVSFVHAEGLDCATTGCGGEASDGVGAADGVLLSGGGVLAVDVRLGGASSLLAFEAQVGAVTDFERPTWWGGLGVRLGKRWAE